MILVNCKIDDSAGEITFNEFVKKPVIHIEPIPECQAFIQRERAAGLTILELTVDVLCQGLVEALCDQPAKNKIIREFAQRQKIALPAVLSALLSASMDCSDYLKLENVQPLTALTQLLSSNVDLSIVKKFQENQKIQNDKVIEEILKQGADANALLRFQDLAKLQPGQVVSEMLKANADQAIVLKFVVQTVDAICKANGDSSVVQALITASKLKVEIIIDEMCKANVDQATVQKFLTTMKLSNEQIIVEMLKQNIDVQKFMETIKVTNEAIIDQMLKAGMDQPTIQNFMTQRKTTQEAVINSMLQQNIDSQLFLDTFKISNQKAIEILNAQKIDVQPFLIKRIASKQMTHQEAICILTQCKIDIQRLVAECNIQQDDVVCGILKAGQQLQDQKVQKQFVISGMLKANIDIAEYVQKNNVGNIEIIMGMLMAEKGDLVVKLMKDKGLTAAQVVSQMCEAGIDCGDFTKCMKLKIEQVVFQMCEEKLDVGKFIEQMKTKNLEVFSKMITAKLSVDAFIEQQKIQIPEIVSGLLLAKQNSEQIYEFAKAYKIQDDDVISQMLNENKSIDDYIQKAPVSNANLISGMCKAGKEIAQIIQQKKIANLDVVCGMLKAKMDMRKIQLQVKLTNEEFMVALQKYEVELDVKVEIAKEYLSKLDEKLELADFIKMYDRIKMDLELETKIIILLLGKTEQKDFCDMLAMLDLDWISKMKILSCVCKTQFPTSNEQELKEEERMLRADEDLYEAKIRQEHKLFMDRICTFNQQRIQQKDLLVLHKSNETSYLYDKIQKLEEELAMRNELIKLQKEKIDNFDQTKQAEIQLLRQAHIQEIEQINKTFQQFRDQNLKNLETEQENVLKYQNETKEFLQKSLKEFDVQEKLKQQEIDDLKQQLKKCQDNAAQQKFGVNLQGTQDVQVRQLKNKLSEQQEFFVLEQTRVQEENETMLQVKQRAYTNLQTTYNKKVKDLQNELDEQFEQNKATIEQIHKENDELIKVKATKITELEAQVQQLTQAQEQLQAQIQLLQEQVFKGENLEKIQEEKQESERVKLLKDDVQRLNAELKRTNEMFIERDVVIAHMFDGAKVEEKQ